MCITENIQGAARPFKYRLGHIFPPIGAEIDNPRRHGGTLSEPMPQGAATPKHLFGDLDVPQKILKQCVADPINLLLYLRDLGAFQ